MKKIFIWVICALLFLYISLCALFYFFQERFIFHPTKLNKEYTFNFTQDFEEINIKTQDNIELSGLLFKTDSIPKGVIFYLHGNAGALDSWGCQASLYTQLGYDIFFLDYRGFGKSGGKITNQEQLLNDVQSAYDEINKRYEKDEIIILGFSIGTGPAAYLASVNNPSILILQAPYYNLTGVIQDICPIIPDFLIRYKLEVNEFITKCEMPVVIFHGDNDNIIDYNNSVELNKLLKQSDILITLPNETHIGIPNNEIYKQRLAEILQ